MPINIGSPESKTVVAAQLAAHGARDIESFMRRCADDCTCFDFSNSVLAAAIRVRRLLRLQEPDLQARLIHRAGSAAAPRYKVAAAREAWS